MFDPQKACIRKIYFLMFGFTIKNNKRNKVMFDRLPQSEVISEKDETDYGAGDLVLSLYRSR